jgi:tetratricopeptide (TPR) repeat protein
MMFSFIFFAMASSALAREYSAEQYMAEGMKVEKQGQYFQAARYYFQALQRAPNSSQRDLAHAHISNTLIAQGLFQSASYFYLKAVSSGDDRTIRLALLGTRTLVDNVGGAIFRKYSLKYTKEDQYPVEAKDYFLYFMAQHSLQEQRPADVVRVTNDMQNTFVNWPSALFLRGTAHLMLGNEEIGINDFKVCARLAEQNRYTRTLSPHEARELRNRCLAGVARGYYQAKDYTQAELWYDQVEMQSMVWPQIQYERAWTAVARGDYNRALGRLVTYKSPGLTWFHDSEVEMLRSISFLQMCIYDDVEKESAQFMKKYSGVGQQIKTLLDDASSGSTRSLVRLFQRGVDAMNGRVWDADPLNQVMNRFVRSPYFLSLASTGNKVRRELQYLNSIGDAGRRGIGGFLREVLTWRWQTAQEQGGLFVRDRLNTEYRALLANVSTIDIVRLEMLRRGRSQIEQLTTNVNAGEDIWGAKRRGSLGRPRIRSNQYFWHFNGEFWADELGEYTFALRPECN